MSDLKTNIADKSTWLRLLQMVVVLFCLWIVAWAIPVLVLLQFGFALITGEDNSNIRAACAVISRYIKQAVDFLTYNSDEPSFPFADLPTVDGDDNIYSAAAAGSDESEVSMEPNIAVAEEDNADNLAEKSDSDLAEDETSKSS